MVAQSLDGETPIETPKYYADPHKRCTMIFLKMLSPLVTRSEFGAFSQATPSPCLCFACSPAAESGATLPARRRFQLSQLGKGLVSTDTVGTQVHYPTISTDMLEQACFATCRQSSWFSIISSGALSLDMSGMTPGSCSEMGPQHECIIEVQGPTCHCFMRCRSKEATLCAMMPWLPALPYSQLPSCVPGVFKHRSCSTSCKDDGH